MILCIILFKIIMLFYIVRWYNVPFTSSLPFQDNLSALMDINDENQQLIAQYEKEKNKRKEFEEVINSN